MLESKLDLEPKHKKHMPALKEWRENNLNYLNKITTNKQEAENCKLTTTFSSASCTRLDQLVTLQKKNFCRFNRRATHFINKSFYMGDLELLWFIFHVLLSGHSWEVLSVLTKQNKVINVYNLIIILIGVLIRKSEIKVFIPGHFHESFTASLSWKVS